MKRAVACFGLLMSISAAVLFFSGDTAWGVALLIAAYANLKVTQRVWP